jgi:hypothetical protein
MNPHTELPRLQTVDDRLARIEDLLVKLGTRFDRIAMPQPNRPGW